MEGFEHSCKDSWVSQSSSREGPHQTWEWLTRQRPEAGVVGGLLALGCLHLASPLTTMAPPWLHARSDRNIRFCVLDRPMARLGHERPLIPVLLLSC